MGTHTITNSLPYLRKPPNSPVVTFHGENHQKVLGGLRWDLLKGRWVACCSVESPRSGSETRCVPNEGQEVTLRDNHRILVK